MKRDYQIDNIKGLLILLVVFGHSLELVRINSGVANFMYIFIYTFHMPVFVFYAGYLSKNYKKGANMAFELNPQIRTRRKGLFLCQSIILN